MEIQIEEVAPCRKRLTVDCSEEDVNQAFEESFKEVMNLAQLPGFRKGHAPRRMIERKFGDQITDDVRGRLFRQGLADGLKRENLSPMGEPEIQLEKLDVRRGQSLQFSTEIDVRPQFELKPCEGLKLTERVRAVSDEEVDERLEQLRARFADYEETNRPAEKENLVEGAVRLTCGEEEVFHQEERAIRIEGSTIFGIEAGDLEEKLGGIQVGETRSIDFTMPDSYPREELRGKAATFTITPTKILETRLPEIDDAFAQRLGMESAQSLSDQIRESIRGEHKNESRQALEEDLLTRLIEENPFDIPQGLKDRQAQANFQRSEMNLRFMGGGNAEIDETQRENLRKESDEQADRQIRRMILFDAIGDKEGVSVSQGELSAHIEQLARYYRTPPKKMLQDIEERQGLGMVEAELRDIKVVQALLDKAEVTELTVDADGNEVASPPPAEPDAEQKEDPEKDEDAKSPSGAE
jgi:trigger factor